MYAVRPLHPKDLSRVLAIEKENPSPWTPAMLFSELDTKNGAQFVAEDGAGNLVGWCCCRFFVPEAELLKISVAKEARRSGVGGLLLERLCTVLRESGVTELFLEVREKNRGALEFYLRNSFITVGRRSGYYSDPTDDALLLRKELQQ